MIRQKPRSARLLLLLLGGLTLAACEPPWSHPTAAKPKPASTTGSISLEAADAAFFANHYTDAEKTYVAFLKASPRSALGHAHYALFLTYARRFSDARAHADSAQAIAPHDGYVLAVATRVKDWTAKSDADLQAAATVGATAVKNAPSQALAHIFYGEALADTGLGDQATRELSTAESLAGGSAYARSEVERERANLARDQGDKTAELQHLLAARTRQPGWAERTRELAEYYFANNRDPEAVAEFRHAVDLAPEDAALRVTLGDVALERQDLALADEAFAGADRLQPHISTTEASLAVAEFNQHHDTARAELLLRQATADDPRDLQIAMLLQGFLRYIKGDAAAANAVGPGGALDENPPRMRHASTLTLDQVRQASAVTALAAVNDARAKTHLPPAHLDPTIMESATAHAYWWIFNLGLPTTKDLGIHREVGNTPGFTGINMRDRATHYGYHNASMSEDITHRGEAAAAVSDWVDSVFHRFPILRSDLDGIGFGMAAISILPIEVMDMSYTDAAGDVRLSSPFPADGQVEVPVAFFGNELPDPVPTGGSYPSGYPVTLNFSPAAHVVIAGWSITDQHGSTSDAYVINPTPASENVLSMLPKKPFAAGSRYAVHVTGTINGSAFTKDWSFTTKAPTTQA